MSVSQMSDDPQFTNLPLIATFLKSFNHAYLGPQANEPLAQDGARANGVGDVSGDSPSPPEGMVQLLPMETQKAMREMMIGYFNSTSKTLVKGQIVRQS